MPTTAVAGTSEVTSAVALTTETSEETTTTLPSQPQLVDVGEIICCNVTVPRMRTNATYRFGLLEVPISITPPMEHWEIIGSDRTGVLIGWRGPSGFKRETLSLLMFDVGTTGTDDAWSRLEALGQAELDAAGGVWTWLDSGRTVVAGSEVEWREVRVGEGRVIPDDPCVVNLTAVGASCIWDNSTARVYVLPVGDLTITFVAYESRCDCVGGSGLESYLGEDNELSQWLNELEVMLAAIDVGG